MDTQLLEMFNRLEAYKVDKQLLLFSNKALMKEISLEMLLRQFKYCVLHSIKDETYSRLRSRLVEMSSEEIVQEMEDCANE